MFALTIYFYSPRAYQYLRRKFENNLPHKSSLQKWYANSNVGSKSAFCVQSVEILGKKTEKLRSRGVEPVCSLIFDEMAIKKHLQWSQAQHTFLGQIDYGFRPDCSEIPLANNAIVFMVNGINFDLTLPLAFNFINNLKAEEKATLLKDMISQVNKCGVKVQSITFDGLQSNFTMCESLGANFNLRKFKPYIVLPGNLSKIYVIVDPSHVLKLVRNTLGNNRILVEGSGGQIEWSFFEKLEALRVEKNFTHMHKLTKKHIEFKNCKMNVRVACETLSNSVANSMKCLREKGHEQFPDSSATEKFIRFINDCFDIMNTKAIKSENKFKNAINSKNKIEIFTFFEEITKYLKKIKFENSNIVLNTRKRTAFRGIIINITNFKSMYEELVESNSLKYLPTFKFSQDHLESFFGRIRSSPGCNDNPTAEQFIASFRKNVVCNEILSSEKSNCEDNLNLTILNVSSRSSHVSNSDNTISTVEKPGDSEHLERSNEIRENFEPNEEMTLSIAYIAGTIEEQIEKMGRFECGDCFDLFSVNDKITVDISSKSNRAPCQSTFDICYVAHKYVQNLSQDYRYTFSNAKDDTLHEFDSETAFSKTNFEGHETHKDFFIEFILTRYIHVQATYIAKRVTLREQKILLRNKLRKFIHFSGQ